MSWPQIKKEIILKWLKWSESLFYATKNHSSTRLWHVTKNGQLARTEKKLQSTSQSPTCTKERSWSLFGGLLPVWSTTALWIPVKPLHLRSILSKSMRCTKNACSWHWSTEWAQSFSTFAQPLIAQPMLQKLNGLGYESFTSSTIFTWPLTNWLPLHASWRLLSGKMLLQGGGRKCAFWVHWIPRHGFLCYRNKAISHWQKCADYNGSYFD